MRTEGRTVGPSLEEVATARARLAGEVLRTPLLALEAPNGRRLHLKCENLQPTGSFKLRGALNALLALEPRELAAGVGTVSAGNMAQALAFGARRLGVPCHVLVPDRAPAAKLRAIERQGACVTRLPFERWWRVMEGELEPELPGHFVHPVCDPAVQAGHGTIALEILEDLPEPGAVLVPFGGGGLAAGIAAVLATEAPRTAVLPVEVEGAAPLAAALERGAPRVLEGELALRPSFVDGIGGRSVLAAQWPRLERWVERSLTVTPAAVAEALRWLAARAHVVAEGAGAAPVAAALAELEREGATGEPVAIVSGGNLGGELFARLLAGELPGA